MIQNAFDYFRVEMHITCYKFILLKKKLYLLLLNRPEYKDLDFPDPSSSSDLSKKVSPRLVQKQLTQLI